MKSITFLIIIVLVTACTPQAVPTVESSPTIAATKPSLATTTPPAPTGTPTQLLPTPTPVFVSVDSIAVGQQGQLYASGYREVGVDLRQVAQWDGTNWVALGDELPTAWSALAVDGAGHLYSDMLKESPQGTATAVMMWDGASWEDITGNFSTSVDALKAGRISSNIPLAGFAVGGEDNLYMAGSYYYPSADHTAEFPMAYVTKWDRNTWTVLGQGFDKVNLFALAVSASGKVYVSGEQPGSGFIAEWDGEKWNQIGTSKLNYCLSIKNLAVDNAGGLYASCTGSGAGELIFHWDGTDWILITDQLQGEAPYIADMAVDENGHLYISGSFDSVSGIQARNIAYWDGNSWQSLGSGVNRPANALAVAPNGDLYAVGAFTEAGDLPTQYLARWDGETWHAMGQ